MCSAKNHSWNHHQAIGQKCHSNHRKGFGHQTDHWDCQLYFQDHVHMTEPSWSHMQFKFLLLLLHHRLLSIFLVMVEVPELRNLIKNIYGYARRTRSSSTSYGLWPGLGFCCCYVLMSKTLDFAQVQQRASQNRGDSCGEAGVFLQFVIARPQIRKNVGNNLIARFWKGSASRGLGGTCPRRPSRTQVL